MTSQISMLYPVKILVGPAQKQELEAYPSSNLAGKGSQQSFFFIIIFFLCAYCLWSEETA